MGYTITSAMNGLLAALLFGAYAFTAQCVWVKEMENNGAYQGDILLDPDEHMPGWKNGSSTFASIKGGRWPGGIIPYFIESSIGYQGIKAIQSAIANYHKYTCLRFHRRTNEREYLSFYRGGGCMSPIGYRAGRVNRISLATGCWYTGVTMHEIGHSIGFWHEQMRPDRDRYVRIIWSNIQRGMNSQFAKCDARIIDSLGTPYDFSSMMHYGSYAFSAYRGRKTIETIDPNNQRLIGQRNGFSEVDKKQIGLMYKNICGKGGTGGGGCVDLNKYCGPWAKRGECQKNPDWMKKNCCKSCKEAGGGGGGDCIDKNQFCSSWAQRGECEKNPVWMKANCCKSCKEYKDLTMAFSTTSNDIGKGGEQQIYQKRHVEST